MSLFIASLNSGSNGNCYYIGNKTDAVLIDAGLTCRETERRMRRLNLDINKVRAVFISHEHGDHIKGMDVIARKYKIPVFITPMTLKNSLNKPDPHLIQHFHASEPVTIGDLQIFAFPKKHDAIDAHSFLVASGGIRVGVFTDIGTPCEHVEHHFSQCHAAFLEANYDEQMLMNGRYSAYLKRRISGDEGHLSNDQAVALFVNHRPTFMSHLLLAHLSKENNNPQIALNAFAHCAGSTLVAIASRDEESPVYEITGTPQQAVLKPNFAPQPSRQISLF